MGTSRVAAVAEVTGTITLADGTTSEFRIVTDYGPPTWHQWGADNHRLGATVDVLDNLCDALQSLKWCE